MAFEARPLRVQLPCETITVIAAAEAEEQDLHVHAHRYWQAVTLGLQDGIGFGEGHCEECSGNPSEPLCDNFSEKPNLHTMVDIRVLPILRRQLEARLQEIARAEEAVAQATREG